MHTWNRNSKTSVGDVLKKCTLYPDMMFGHAILTHAGAGSHPEDADGPLSAAQIGMGLMHKEQSALNAVVNAVRHLENDPRFNAGIGSQRRADGRTIQLDAACMSCNGQFGAVACVEGIQNPVDLAQEVLLHSSHILIAGNGARIFAQEHNIPTLALSEADTRKTPDNTIVSSCDTVGAVAFDGTTFAAALSSGGLAQAAIGRVGDVPLPGCGLFCGPLGAIACSGNGEFIALKMLAREVYGWLEKKMSPCNAAQKAMTLFDDSVDIGLIILTKTQFASHARNGMAWSQLTDTR